MPVSFPDVSCTLSSFVDIVRSRALHQSKERAFTYLHSDAEESYLTYEGLDIRARAIGAVLQEQMFPGDRALLLYPPGLDFITALLGCFYAGVIAVPAYLPGTTKQNRGLITLCSITNNARPSAILTKSASLTSL